MDNKSRVSATPGTSKNTTNANLSSTTANSSSSSAKQSLLQQQHQQQIPPTPPTTTSTTTNNTNKKYGANYSTQTGGGDNDEDDDDFDLMNNDDDDDDDIEEDDDDDDHFMDDDDDDTSNQLMNHGVGGAASRIRTDAILIDAAQPLSSSSLPNHLSTSLSSKYTAAGGSGQLSVSQRSTNAHLIVSKSKRQHELDEEFKFEVLTPDKIVQHMIECIKEVNQVIQLPPTTTRILLHHFRWDKEKLMERFYDGDQERLFKEAHIVSPFKTVSRKLSGQRSTTSSSSSSGSSRSKQAKEFYCEICYLPTIEDNMSGLECEHKFCKLCWREYLKTKIMDEGMGLTISCAAHKCDILVDDNTVMSLVDDQAVKIKYQHLITNSFVECNRLMRWCPAPNCKNAIKAQYYDTQPVQCICQHIFCFGCGELWHDPVKCKWLKKWIKKCDDDSETSNWIAANTKECPKCQVTIEKNGGCNHMICKNQACRSEFCWVCLGAWEPHGSSWYNCNRYNEDDAKKARDAQEKSRSALQRYLHYCNRYMNHYQSLKLEQKLIASIREKMEEMQQHNMSWIEVQFLRKAVDVLCLCRQTLMYTYAFAFYLKKNNHSIIFEDNQSDLEIAVEKLSGYLERDITSDNAIDIKQQVQDKYRYCEHRRNVLLDHVHEGYEKDYWEYQEDL